MLKKHLYKIDILKFLCTLIIIIYHQGLLGTSGRYLFFGGYIFVEMFFMITGYFTIRHFEQVGYYQGHEASTAVNYTFKKIGRLMPYIIICVFVHDTWLILSQQSSLKEYVFMPFEMLLLRMGGLSINEYLHITPLWYVSAILFVLPVIIYFFLKYKDVMFNFVIWYLPIFIYGYFLNTCGNMNEWGNWTLYGNIGIYRAVAGILLGILVYKISERMKHLNFVIKHSSKFFCLGTCGVLAGAIVTCYKASSYWDFILIGILFISFLFIVIGDFQISHLVKQKNDNNLKEIYLGSKTLRKISGKGLIGGWTAGMDLLVGIVCRIGAVCCELGGGVMNALYICHYTVGYMVRYYMSQYRYKFALYIVFTIFYAIILEYIIKWLRSMRKNN